ncbi:MAG: transketolase [Saprospiraceae bacterium]|nr:transketolase [Saprospiraceae bacterium]MCB9325148.1 transketolase [Lewinellaceae bacterium]
MKFSREEILRDYYTCCVSRQVSLLIRKEVLIGRAKFGVYDDGKELLHVAMAKVFEQGDFRADYYRGHTLLIALNLCKIEDIFAQLYADGDNDPFSGGRQMNGHHATPLIDKKGEWLPHKNLYNLSSDISTTAGQMARGFGLAYASKVYKESPLLQQTPFSDQGKEVCFCNIGDGSTSEGPFWEAMNAAGVTQIPLVVSVFDDGYAISVPRSVQTVKDSISRALRGFQKEEGTNGIEIYRVNGWDYIALCKVYQEAVGVSRATHTPALIHVDELTQPQGHSTSGSHERYKSKERLEWEREYDCNLQFRQWIINNEIADEEALFNLENKALKEAKLAKDNAWKAYHEPIKRNREALKVIYTSIAEKYPVQEVQDIRNELETLINPVRVEIVRNIKKMLFLLRKETLDEKDRLVAFLREVDERMARRYHSHLYSETNRSALKVPVVEARYSDESPLLNGYEVLNRFFDKTLQNRKEVYSFGEDVGVIGGVNQGFAGLQEKFGAHRVFDTSIREWTIIGQAIGMAMRGLRPIAEIQYLDYLIYAYSPLSDDLATLRYRTNNIQMAPAIIRTRGHRLEGIWHSGSPMSLLLGGLRGIYILTPRNMVQAAGMYNTMLESDDPAILIECLNGYRLKEKLPDNYDTFTVPLGIPEVLEQGTDVTLVTYGSCVRIAQEAIEMLKKLDISVELIDVQTLLPFDIEHRIVESLKKTNRIVFLDEDVPGGAAAYMMQHVLEEQKGYFHLDAQPRTITAQAHRPAYASDGDYYSKPNPDDVYEVILEMMLEAEPERF